MAAKPPGLLFACAAIALLGVPSRLRPPNLALSCRSRGPRQVPNSLLNRFVIHSILVSSPISPSLSGLAFSPVSGYRSEWILVWRQREAFVKSHLRSEKRAGSKAAIGAVLAVVSLFCVGVSVRNLLRAQEFHPARAYFEAGGKVPHGAHLAGALHSGSDDPALIGQWAAPVSLGMIPIHAALLYTGKLLFWEYPNLQGTGGTLSILYDPIANAVTNLSPTGNDDFFCAGLSQLPDGRILVDGGLNGPLHKGPLGTKYAYIFDPSSNTWTAQQNMKFARYYPTNIQYPDGTALAVSGNNAKGGAVIRPMEHFDPVAGTWTTLPSTANLPLASWDNYPRMFLLPSGNIVTAGQIQQSWMFAPSTNSWTYVGDLNYSFRHGEGAVLMPSLEQVMVIGGQVPQQTPTNTTEMIDFTQPTPQWTYGIPMNFARQNLNAVQLPDGTILVVGGAGGSQPYQNPVKTAEVYNPATSTWSLLAAQAGSRGYHSTALLLPNGTVISEGSDSGNTLQTYAEIYSPPYLFNGPQPTITAAPTSVNYGANFTITTPDAANITSVVLMRNDAVTHADHFDQRMVPLAFTTGSGELTATAPASGDYAPPGYYMLFIVNSSGVPSVAPFVNLNTASGHAQGR